MSVRVVIVEDPLDPRRWEDNAVEDVRDFLMERFGTWPTTARIYDLEGFEDIDRAAGALMTTVLASRDVTPRDEAGVERLGRLPGPLVVAVAPADPITAIIAVVAVAVGVAAAVFLMPKIPDINNTFQSPNNSLSDRTNKPRPNARIPDILGTVRSTPDLLSVPYRMFENNLELEVAYMCVGRGEYDLSDVRDGDTLLTSIAGSGATFYGPNTSPNSGAPQLQIGSAIGQPVLSVVKMNEVNGQVLKPSNSNFFKGDDNIRFVYPDQIQRTGSGPGFDEKFETDDSLTVGGGAFSGTPGTVTLTASARFTFAGEIELESVNPTTTFSAGQYITVTNGGFVGEDGLGNPLYVDLSGTYQIASVSSTKITLVDPSAVNSDWDTLDDFPSDRTDYRSVNLSRPEATNSGNLDGTYTVLSVTSNTITLSNPALVNAAWDNLDDLPGGATEYMSPSLSTSGERWVGPFVVDINELDRVLSNFVALSGLYQVNKKGKQYPLSVNLVVELMPVDSDDSPIGPPETFPVTLTGSGDNKETVGVSLMATPSFTGRTRVRARRTSPTDYDYDGTIVDEVKWRDGYGMAAVDLPHFGNITTVHARTYATSGATSVRDRKLNLKARRRLPARISGSTFSTTLVGTDRVDAIMSAICLDPYIGNYAPELVDFDNIYDTVAQVEDYFGSARAVEFGYTFDDDNISFEETLATVANCCFSRAYRQGSLIRIAFERARDSGVLLFNHRNVLPRTQERSHSFGVTDDHDGVEFDWTAAKDGATLTYDIPYDRSAVTPRKVEVPGVRSGELAYWHSWRAWNRLRFQSATLEQETTQEAALVLPADRVRITDLTRPPGYEGEVLSSENGGLDLELSQPAPIFEEGVNYTIFLQHVDATVEALSVGPWTPAPGEEPDDHMVRLATAPRLDLALGEGLSARPGYEIVPSTDRRSRGWLVTEREPNSNFTETVRAVNYSPMYYINDEIVTWLPFSEASFRDQSPWMRDGVGSGDAFTAYDEVRGKFVYSSAAGTGGLSFDSFDPPSSYTKAVWTKAVNGAEGNFLAAYSTGETFALTAGGTIGAGHGAFQVSAPAPFPGEWHYAAVTYDAASGDMVLYVDGEEVDAATGVVRGALGQLTAFNSLAGRYDDLRLWKRALSGDEVRSLYRSTRQPFV